MGAGRVITRTPVSVLPQRQGLFARGASGWGPDQPRPPALACWGARTDFFVLTRAAGCERRAALSRARTASSIARSLVPRRSGELGAGRLIGAGGGGGRCWARLGPMGYDVHAPIVASSTLPVP